MSRKNKKKKKHQSLELMVYEQDLSCEQPVEGVGSGIQECITFKIQEVGKIIEMKSGIFRFYQEMKKVKKQRCEYVVNAYGIAVKKACVSCAHKEFTRALSKRYCTEHEREVKPTQVCSLWKMSNQMKMAGSARGVVRDIVTKEEVIV